jgi:Uma2 family endonuclease
VLTEEQIAPKRAVPILRTAYHQLGELGFYEGLHVQLVYGTVIDMGSMAPLHANAIRALTRAFVTHSGPAIEVMVQLPIAAADDSEPEPDFAFIRQIKTPSDDHPTTALLVVEVADTSLRLDLGPKAALYAECKVPEYWVIDLKARSTVVHRVPRRGMYSSVRRVPWANLLTSTGVAGLSLRLGDILGA